MQSRLAEEFAPREVGFIYALSIVAFFRDTYFTQRLHNKSLSVENTTNEDVNTSPGRPCTMETSLKRTYQKREHRRSVKAFSEP